MKRLHSFRRRCRHWAAAFGICCAAGLGGCLSSEPQDEQTDVYKIGVLLPLSGENAAYGQRILQGIELAKDQLNGQEPFLAKPIRLFVEDDGSRSVQAISGMQALDREGVLLVIGGYTTDTALSMRSQANALKLPVVTPSASGEDLTERSRYMMRSCFSDRDQAEALADYTLHKRNIRTVAVLLDLDDDGTYSRMLARLFSRFFTLKGGTVVKTVGFRDGEGYSNVMREAIAAKPEAIFAPVYPEDAAQIVNQAREQGFTGTIFGADGWDEPEFLNNLTHAADGPLYHAAMFSSQLKFSPQLNFFNAAMFDRTGRVPSNCEALGFDVMSLVGSVLDGKADRESLLEAFLGIRNFDALTGRISMLPDGNAAAGVIIKKIVDADGKPEAVLDELVTVPHLNE
mgnify:CR=1 FL=1